MKSSKGCSENQVVSELPSMHKKAQTSHGKWSVAGIPHRGWECISVEDMDEPSQLCEMCESVDVRYVHVMQHSEYPDVLHVGCVCAEHMEEDYARPRAREKGLRSIARRRKSWARREWRLSRQGNIYLNTEGFNLTIFRQLNQRKYFWIIRVENHHTGISKTGRKRFETEEEARLAALNALIWAKTNLVA